MTVFGQKAWPMTHKTVDFLAKSIVNDAKIFKSNAGSSPSSQNSGWNQLVFEHKDSFSFWRFFIYLQKQRTDVTKALKVAKKRCFWWFYTPFQVSVRCVFVFFKKQFLPNPLLQTARNPFFLQKKPKNSLFWLKTHTFWKSA